jgi:hypothetical protein
MTAFPRAAKLLVLSTALLVLAVASSSGGQAGTFYPAGGSGYDVSFPQCGRSLPPGGSFGIVGVNNGLPWSANPCLTSEYQWARSKSAPPSLFMNTANPGPISKYWNRPGPQTCKDPVSYQDSGCAYNYGWNAAADAFTLASTATSGASATNYWWLDVETVNSWNGTPQANTATIAGYIDSLTGRGVAGVGIYSTTWQWGAITGGSAFPGIPNWVAQRPA